MKIVESWTRGVTDYANNNGEERRIVYCARSLLPVQAPLKIGTGVVASAAHGVIPSVVGATQSTYENARP